ncbi:MAG: SprT-like domain-containing protein [Bacteroidia bacterium]|jgi:SprT protein
MTPEQRQQYAQVISKYVPETTIHKVVDWVEHYRFKLKITRARSTKLGDFMNGTGNSLHQITVNHDLNTYSFFITLVHEVAHLATYNQYKHTVKPHGDEWKFSFKILMQPFLTTDVFPADVLTELRRMLANPTASCTDVALQRVLRNYNADAHSLEFTLIENLLEGQQFEFKDQRFLIKEIRRKRYLCLSLDTQKEYSFSPLAEVRMC